MPTAAAAIKSATYTRTLERSTARVSFLPKTDEDEEGSRCSSSGVLKDRDSDEDDSVIIIVQADSWRFRLQRTNDGFRRRYPSIFSRPIDAFCLL